MRNEKSEKEIILEQHGIHEEDSRLMQAANIYGAALTNVIQNVVDAKETDEERIERLKQ